MFEWGSFHCSELRRSFFSCFWKVTLSAGCQKNHNALPLSGRGSTAGNAAGTVTIKKKELVRQSRNQRERPEKWLRRASFCPAKEKLFLPCQSFLYTRVTPIFNLLSVEIRILKKYLTAFWNFDILTQLFYFTWVGTYAEWPTNPVASLDEGNHPAQPVGLYLMRSDH